MTILTPDQASFDLHMPVLVVGGGGCGLTAALAVREQGVDVLVLEADATTMGTTAMSTGLIPAAGTRFQKEAGIDDSPQMFTDDVMAKTKGQTDQNIMLALARESAATIEWLVDSHDVPLTLVDSFTYPGHSVMRMHGSPNRTGAELMGSLSQAVERAGVDVLTEARVINVFASADGVVAGVRCQRPDGATEDVSCDALILACCGFAGNTEMVAKLIPEIADATFFGHPGNKGEAIVWGQEMGAAVDDIHAYQGHGGLAVGQGVPILWPVIMEGGVQVNTEGLRFSNESRGYSEQAVDVVAQPDSIAWTVYDQRLHELMQEFDDYRDAMAQKAIRSADDVAGLAEAIKVPADALQATLEAVADSVNSSEADAFGRVFASRPTLSAPFYAVKVTGALFHTQGGLRVDHEARVLREDNEPFANLFAGGGAARGISGSGASGYLAGNGLLTATTFGRLAGRAAARQCETAE